VTDYVDYSGRTDAVDSVSIRARVTGYLVRMPFKEGAEVRGDDRQAFAARVLGLLAASRSQASVAQTSVAPVPLVAAASLFPGQGREGDLLFEIDPRPYQTLVDQAQSQLTLSQAQLNLARVTYERYQSLSKLSPGGVSALQLDQAKAGVDEAEARIKTAQAVLDGYKLNLSFTQVRSPISGQASRYFYTVGNLVNQDQTLLTTVVSLDPMYVYFDMDERTLRRVRTAIIQGKIQMPKDQTAIPLYIALEGEEGYPHQGIIDFVNPTINPSTGTVAVRGRFANPKSEQGLGRPGVRLLSPGMYVKVRLPIGQPHSALLVIDRAIGSDQGLKFVYVVDKENKVHQRRIRTGSLQEDGLRVIEEGQKPEERLNPDDWIVVGGLQQIQPRMEIQPEQREMPTLGGTVVAQTQPAVQRGPSTPADPNQPAPRASNR
jgi:multidrug efflux system membrane fusion protein